MIKLKDGRVLTLSEFGGFYIADIRGQKKVPVKNIQLVWQNHYNTSIIQMQ